MMKRIFVGSPRRRFKPAAACRCLSSLLPHSTKSNVEGGFTRPHQIIRTALLVQRASLAYPTRAGGSPTALFTRNCGFTLIEVSLSLVLLAMSAALSLPSYRELMEKRQSTQSAEQIEMHSISPDNRLDLTADHTRQVVLCSNDANQSIPTDNTCPDPGVQQ